MRVMSSLAQVVGPHRPVVERLGLGCSLATALLGASIDAVGYVHALLLACRKFGGSEQGVWLPAAQAAITAPFPGGSGGEGGLAQACCVTAATLMPAPTRPSLCS
jgi:hypothetical protein